MTEGSHCMDMFPATFPIWTLDISADSSKMWQGFVMIVLDFFWVCLFKASPFLGIHSNNLWPSVTQIFFHSTCLLCNKKQTQERFSTQPSYHSRFCSPPVCHLRNKWSHSNDYERASQKMWVLCHAINIAWIFHCWWEKVRVQQVPSWSFKYTMNICFDPPDLVIYCVHLFNQQNWTPNLTI